MASGDSPLVARRRVRRAVREAREAKGLTQSQVAEAMEWSLSKVMRIESGEVTISPNDLRPLLSFLGVTSGVDDLIQDARTARRRRMWFEEPGVREHLTPALGQLIQYETEAVAVRHFYGAIIPGRLQTPAYAELVLRTYAHTLPAEDLKVRLEARLRRRAEFLARKDPPEIFLLLDESVLHRELGGRQVIGEQLLSLVKLTKEKRLRVRVVPFSGDAPPPMLGSYEILDLSRDDDDAIMYLESHTLDQIVEDKATIARFRDIFDEYWAAALDETTSVRFTEERARALLSSVDKVDKTAG
ncbi:helix-turn-helix domain-containing protein [Planosporangium thailandense]|uniref:Helix-turn-helix domain-containing protein n=1 Tax=Planosporangium thailandense TaxID=765197 RepID=A0ABX0XSK2_9ACTN|nr:helix-turn-helix transcriptional regulator [Planosporangium thailandense]NJC68986.1 helix-turn-helix domain-containing protein [Planosporangium thailandense]